MAYANANVTLEAGHGLIAGVRSRVSAWADRAYRVMVYVGTIRALRELNDRHLADLGIARSDIKRIAKEAAYGA